MEESPLSVGLSQPKINHQKVLRFLNPKKRKALFMAAAAAVLLDGTYSAFMFETAPKGVSVMLKQCGLTLTSTELEIIKYILLPFILGNLVADLTAIDIKRESDELTLSSQGNKAKQPNFNTLNKVAIFLGLALKINAVIGDYPVAASADVIPVADFVTESFGSTAFADALRYSSLIVIGSLEVLYLILFINSRLQKHADAFVNTLTELPNFLRYIVRHPFHYMEVNIQLIANAINRAILYSFITRDVIKEVFHMGTESSTSRVVSIAMGVNAIHLTFFSRYLSVYNKFQNPNFEYIAKQEYQKASGLNKPFMLDMVFSLIRSSMCGMVSYEFLPLSNPWNYITAASIGSLFFLQSSYAHYQMRLANNALTFITKEELEARKQVATAAKKARKIGPINEDKELTPLLVEQKHEDSLKVEIINKFDTLAKQQHSVWLEFGVDVIANVSQLVRLFAFWLFVESINETVFNGKIGQKMLFALTLLWGVEVFKNNRELFRNAMMETWTGMTARSQLEKNREQAQPANYSQTAKFWSLWRPFKVLTSSPYDYAVEELERAIQQGNKK